MTPGSEIALVPGLTAMRFPGLRCAIPWTVVCHFRNCGVRVPELSSGLHRPQVAKKGEGHCRVRCAWLR
eukprot:2735629-Rhodomonas_salina.1